MIRFLLIITLIFITHNSLQAQVIQTGAEDYVKRASYYFQKEDLDTALSEVNKAIAINPKLVNAFFLRSAIRTKKGDIEGTLSDYNKIIELAPNTTNVEVIYTNRSMIRLQKGNIDGALIDLDKAISINPKVDTIYNSRAIARLQKGDLTGSLADYERTLELNPNLVSALLGRGYFHYQNGEFDSAITDFSKAITIKPDYALAYVERGIAQGLKGDIDASIADIKKGYSINQKSVSEVALANFTTPFIELNQFIAKNLNNARAYEIQGVLRLLQGNETQANEDFCKSQELNSKLKPEIDKIIMQIKKPVKESSKARIAATVFSSFCK